MDKDVPYFIGLDKRWGIVETWNFYLNPVHKMAVIELLDPGSKISMAAIFYWIKIEGYIFSNFLLISSRPLK